MPAYFDCGFTVREPAWHGQGIVLGEYPTSWAEARKYAGLQWEPEERPHFVARYLKEFTACRACEHAIGDSHDVDCLVGGEAARLKVELIDAAPQGSQITADGLFVFVPDPGHKDIVRDDTFGVIGIANEGYSTIYHGKQQDAASMEQIIEAYLGADGSVRFETGGVLKDGSVVWALIYLDEPYKIPGDSSEHLPFAALINFHDGNGACKLVYTQVRVVCWNTAQLCLTQGDRNGQQITFRHTGDVSARIEEAKENLVELRDEAKQYVALGETLLQIEAADDTALDKWLSEFLPNPAENGEVVSDRVQENVGKARSAFKHVYANSATCSEIAGTAYGLVQASTEYLDHVRAFRSQESYLGRSILRPEPAKAKALAIAGGLFRPDLAKLDTEWAKRLVELGDVEASQAASVAPRAKQVLTTV